MKRLIERLPLMAKVALAPLLVLLCLVIVAGSNAWTARKTAATLDMLTQQSMVRVAQAAETQQRVVAANAMVMQSIAYAGAGLKPEVIQALDKRIDAELLQTQSRIDTLRTALAGDAAQAARAERLHTAFGGYVKAARETLDMKDADLSTAATFMSRAEKAYDEARGVLAELSAEETRAATARGEQTAATLQAGRNFSLLLTAAALLAGLLATWASVRLIVTPLRSALQIAREVADGNLRTREVAAAADETGQVLGALAEVTRRLNATVAGIRQGADQIDTAAREIALGNGDLSARTEQTASALQQTAASLQQLTDTVAANARNADTAHRLAGDAARIAADGGTAVDEVVRTMDAISTQSRRIGEIIGTIDGLAFQTNILALNAAVEAARAGDAGRGFAVVAQEVRGLAQRSAGAAKEIRGLIGSSVQQVEAGATKVQHAGAMMQRIVDGIGQVNTVVAEISRASAEQSVGIHEVNSAVGAMDRSTQQNAALVEEAAAAAESLRQQAQGLVAAVGAFRIA
ncbi:methyl-accepting chemotaxis protein [Aquabacterium humicola]|uniref:methyl-accepting chemotaxis protein n=1 Tax=Aquabacterium humicola TaxID=3237377 RepID=UPI002543903F|nr:methyl-accepting chemotaxis protein [Rubrivivax pictus]